MVAPTADTHDPSAPRDASASAGPDDKPPRPGKGGVRRLTSSAVRLATLQLKIWLTQLKMTALKIGLFAGLFVGAAVLGVMAIIFLYIGVFKIFTELLNWKPVWAFLLMGGVHILLAAVLIMVAIKLLTKKDPDDDEDDEKAADKKPRDAHGHPTTAAKEKA